MARLANGSRRSLETQPSEATYVLDNVDLRILCALQIKGRATNVEIAEYANVTPPSSLRRMRRLEELGVIRDYHANLDAKKLGYEVVAFVQVRLDAHADTLVRQFEACIQALPNVRECYALSGHRDFLLKCAFRNLADSQRFVTQTLLTMHNVAAATTSFCIRASKNEPGVPLALVADPAPSAAARKLKLPPLPRK